MSLDYLEYAHNLHIIPVWSKGPANTSGYLTPPVLYNGYRPFTPRVGIIHATVGTNTLPYFASKVDANWDTVLEAGSIRDGRFVCAHQLIPKDDFTIYDMVPSGFGCGHCNPGSWRGVGTLNLNAYGIECENRQDNIDPFTDSQYIKLALTWAYKSALHSIYNTMLTSHHLAAPTHRSDPDSSPFDYAQFYGHLWELRKNEAIFTYWNVDWYQGH